MLCALHGCGARFQLVCVIRQFSTKPLEGQGKLTYAAMGAWQTHGSAIGQQPCVCKGMRTTCGTYSAAWHLIIRVLVPTVALQHKCMQVRLSQNIHAV